jgi:hypothetical protein
VVDMVLDIVVGRSLSPNGAVILDDWFPEKHEKHRVVELFTKARPKINPQHWEKIETWLASQSS